jgi:hypothetical protein
MQNKHTLTFNDYCKVIERTPTGTCVLQCTTAITFTLVFLWMAIFVPSYIIFTYIDAAYYVKLILGPPKYADEFDKIGATFLFLIMIYVVVFLTVSIVKFLVQWYDEIKHGIDILRNRKC